MSMKETFQSAMSFSNSRVLMTTWGWLSALGTW